MLALSPILKFAFESFEHALEQYMVGSDKSRKFCILHCDQAIELILKEKMRSIGESIFKNQGKTIDFHESLNKLTNEKGVKIPEGPNLELIHDLRNIIQHKGATVSIGETEFYIKVGFDFIKRFVKEELGVDLKENLPERYYGIFEPHMNVITANAAIKLADKAEIRSIPIAKFLSTILAEYTTLMFDILELASKLRLDIKGEGSSTLNVVDLLVSKGYLPPEAVMYFNKIRTIRNAVAHSNQNVTENEVKEFMLALSRFRSYLENVSAS